MNIRNLLVATATLALTAGTALALGVPKVDGAQIAALAQVVREAQKVLDGAVELTGGVQRTGDALGDEPCAPVDIGLAIPPPGEMNDLAAVLDASTSPEMAPEAIGAAASLGLFTSGPDASPEDRQAVYEARNAAHRYITASVLMLSWHRRAQIETLIEVRNRLVTVAKQADQGDTCAQLAARNAILSAQAQVIALLAEIETATERIAATQNLLFTLPLYMEDAQ